jgi:hypothetical protein
MPASRAWTLGVLLVVLAPVARSTVWGPPTLSTGLAGRGDMLAAATDGGVVLWNLASGEARWIGSGFGLPSPQVNSIALDGHDDVLLAATAQGLARGWWEGPWSATLADSGESDNVFLCSAPRPGGGSLAGGAGGRLAAWMHDTVATLRLPTARDPVVALACAPRVLETPLAGDLSLVTQRDVPSEVLAVAELSLAAGVPRDLDPAAAPAFPPGLAVGTDGGGLWLLRSTGAWTRWIQLTPRDGLPSARVRALATDAAGRLWVATPSGLARVRRGLVVDAWADDPLLGHEVLALLGGPDGKIYLGLGDGVARLDPVCEHPCVRRLATTRGPVQALAWVLGELWWTEGAGARALSGRTLTPGHFLHVAERLGARWQPTPLWPGASAVQDPGAATETLCEPPAEYPRSARTPRGSWRWSQAPPWFDVRGRLVPGPARARGVYFVPVWTAAGACEVRRQVLLHVTNR